MHILQQALQEMSLQGSAAKFPDHKEVLVKANKIDSNERALMLYRHARAASLDEGAKAIVRKHAKGIVDNHHFTPERIRRFVKEALLDLHAQVLSGDLGEEALKLAVTEAIENPTERMRKSYRQLDDEQRAVLVAMLDCKRSPAIDDLGRAVARFREPRRPIQEAINLLKEGFLQDSTPNTSYTWTNSQGAAGVDWIHPSYRDLVIEELERDALASEHFLQNCSWVGLQLTLSIAGGDRGQRRYPLMKAEKSWMIVENRLISLLNDTVSDYQIREILQAVRASLDGADEDVRDRLAKIIKACCDSLRNRLDQGQIELNERILKEYFDLTMAIVPPPPMPNAYHLWKDAQQKFEAMLANAEDEPLNDDILSRWIEVIQVVIKTDRRLLLQDGFPERYEELIQKLCEIIKEQASASVSYTDDDEMSSEADRFATISMSIDDFAHSFPQLEDDLQNASHSAHHRSTRLRNASRSGRGNDQTILAGRSTGTSVAIDLDRLFSDL
jgi:hypothetical protein